MRLAEKGYSVCILEQGMRFKDNDFARSNWNIWKYLWAPVLRCFGIQQISLFKNVVVLHFAGVGGGSLGYANVLMRPSDMMFRNPSWKHLADWKTLLAPHYLTAERMLGVVENPCFHKSDLILKEISTEKKTELTFKPTRVGVYFGQPGITSPDPYFGGAGPSRRGCTQCGGCMVGCRENSKNSLEKNYLFFAEKGGAKILPGSRVRDVVPISSSKIDDSALSAQVRIVNSMVIPSKKTNSGAKCYLLCGIAGNIGATFSLSRIDQVITRYFKPPGDDDEDKQRVFARFGGKG